MSVLVLPPGRFALTPALDDRVRALALAPPRRGDRAHPVFAYLGALNGLPQPIGDVSRSLGLAFDHGPVLGGCVMRFPGPLRVGRVYEVWGEVASVTRKPSRRFGRADHAAFLIALCEGDAAASILEFTMVTPVVEAP